MSLIRYLAGFLADNGFGTVWNGSTGNIFVEDVPADPANAIMLASLISPAPSEYLNTQTLDFEVWCRNQSPKTGSDKLTDIFLRMHRFHHLTLGDYYIYFIGAQGNIENLDRDVEGRSLQKINFRAIYIDRRVVS